MVTYPYEWKELSFKKTINSVPFNIYLKQPRISGEFIVVQQGDSPIAGYANGSPYRDYKKVVLFGDHTLSLYKPSTPFFVATDGIRILSCKENIDRDYLYYFLQKYKPESEGYKRHFSILLRMDVFLPELSEQQAIASVLSDFDEHIDNLSELIEKKKAIRDGALEDLLSGRTRLDGFNGEWEEKSFKDLGDILTGLTYSPDNIRPSGKLVIRSSNVQDDRLSFEDNVFVDRTCVISEDIKKGDIILCVRNGSASLIGKSAYANSDLDATFGAFMSNFRCKNHDSSGFVYYFTKSVMFKKFVKQILGATINQITKTDLKRVTLKIPVDIEEQQAITQVLTAMDEEIESLKIEKEKMIQIKEGAMDDLLTGRVRLKV